MGTGGMCNEKVRRLKKSASIATTYNLVLVILNGPIGFMSCEFFFSTTVLIYPS